MMSTPLAEKLRPRSLDELVGQDELTCPNGLIRKSIQNGSPLSLLLWGPPGCGKTSLALSYAKAFSMRFVKFSAVFNSISDIKKIIKEELETPLFQEGCLIFVDEIHRFNKAQQDAFLPFLEDGTLYLIGATTENPSLYLNSALLSRMRVFEMAPLSEAALEKLLLQYEKRVGPLNLNAECRQALIGWSQGDGRYLYNLIEGLEGSEAPQSLESLSALLQRRAAHYDRADQHYNLISALHKAVRGSDPQAALYWFARMLEGGEDPRYLARRLIRMAAEDIGLADPQSLELAVAAKESYESLGSPEGELALAQAVVYLALAPKSNSLYKAYGKARRLAAETTHLPPPKTILNAPTRLMKECGYGAGYLYDHDLPEGFSGQDYFPQELPRTELFSPVERGFERELKRRLDYLDSLR